MPDLSSIQTLYRGENMVLWGIPFRMRDDVGQSPRDLERAQQESNARGPLPPGVYGSPPSSAMKDWVWLGQPGWWGHLSREDQEQVQGFLASLPFVPESPFEWCYVEAPDEGA